MVYKPGQVFLPFCHNTRVWRTDIACSAVKNDTNICRAHNVSKILLKTVLVSDNSQAEFSKKSEVIGLVFQFSLLS